MNRKTISLMIVSGAIFFAVACNSNNKGSDNTTTSSDNSTSTTTNEGSNPKGVGPHQNIQLTHPLDEKMIAEGQNVYNVKCASCHKTTDEKLVGPGWKGVTDRRKPEWIMNMVTNVDVMLDQDPEAQKLLELCLTRMPNQNVSVGDARDVLEFMRQNDGQK